MSYQKPFYSLRVSSKHLSYMLCVNGCYVEVHGSDEPLTIEYPVNQWLKNGDNSIDVYQDLLPDHELDRNIIRLDSEMIVELLVKEFGENESVCISKLCFDGAKLPRVDMEATPVPDFDASTELFCKGSSMPGQYSINGNTAELNPEGEYGVGDIGYEVGPHGAPRLFQHVSLPLPLPKWHFFNAEKLPIHFSLSDDEWQTFREEVLPEYQRIYDALEAQDWQTFESLCKRRCDEYDLALYREPGESLKLFIDGYKLDASDLEWELVPLAFDRVDIAVAFNNQLVWMHGWDNPLGHCIWLSHTKSDMCYKYHFMFAKFDGKWQVVR